MRRIVISLVVLLVLAGLVLAVDQWIESTAEARAQEQISERLGTPTEVELRGWPVGLRLLAGSVPEVLVRATDVPVEGRGPRIDELRVRLTDVAIDVRSPGDELPQGETATFTAVIAEASLRELVDLPSSVLDITLEQGSARIAVLGQAIPADVVAEDGNVVLRPQLSFAAVLGLDRIPLDLSAQPGGPYVREVEVREDALVLRGELRELER
jgi:hypothetical protein